MKKNDKTIRICLDPNELNKAIKRDYYLIPKFENIRDKLWGKQFYTVLDIKKGFWHIELESESSELCCFSTPFGYYKFNRLPFGLSCAPEAFIKLNQKYFGNIDPNNIIIYFDDIPIATRTEQEHNELLKKVVDAAKAYNVRFNIDKLQFKQSNIKFLGHIFCAEGIKPDIEQVKAITKLADPKNKKELQSILGMANYLREFIPNMAELISPFRDLLKNNTIFSWNEYHSNALSKLKKVIANLPVLRHFDPEKSIVIQADASKDGMGCCLMQEGLPISFASRSMTPTECSYSQIEKELLSLIFACRKFHYYIYGRPIIAYTDHAPLLAIMKKEIAQIPSNRLQKMKLKLFNYDIELRYLPGKKMYVADLLSRNYLPEKYSSEIDTDGRVHCINRYNSELNKLYDIKKETENDIVLNKVKTYLSEGWPDKNRLEANVIQYFGIRNDLIIDNEILYFGNRIIVPHTLRKVMLNLLHESHQGITKTRLRAKLLFYWPGMMNEIEQLVGKCKVCEKFRPANKKEPLLTHELPNLPYEKIAMDIMTFNNNDYLVVIDYYSKWIDVCHLKSKTTNEIISHLKQLFSIHGIPKFIISDNMPFGSFEFKEFARNWNFKNITSSPNYPKSNGEAEKAVHIAKQMLKKCCDKNEDLSIALLEYRCTPVPSLNATPSELLMSRLLRTKLPVSNLKLTPRVQNGTLEKLRKNQEKYKNYHDRTAKSKIQSFKPNQNVVMRKENNWVPGKIVRHANEPRSYYVKNESGNILRRNAIHLRPSQNEPEICNDSEADEVDVQNTNVANGTIANEGCIPKNTSEQLYKTRFGRNIVKPDMFNDYVTY